MTTAAHKEMPTSKTSAALFLYDASNYLDDGLSTQNAYNDRKASRLLEAKADLLIAEARIESWFVDLGFDGQCQVENSSIGGVPCIMPTED